MLDSFIVLMHVLVAFVFLGSACLVRTPELLLLQLLLRESMDWHELCLRASDWALGLVLYWLLLDPALDALPTERSLTLLALEWIRNHFQADLANKK